MHWIKAEEVKIENGNYYLVRTNGREYGDHDLHLWPAPLLERHMRPEIVRGRPVWVALVTEPGEDFHV